MYWIYLFIFLIAVLIPDIVRGSVLFLSETRAEEVSIFLLGAIGFLIFLKNERMLSVQRKQKEKDQKKLDQTVKDLVESYSYIGEVNRKMDLIMNIALGLSDRSMLSKSKENDIYESIAEASNSLLKGDMAFLRFVDVKLHKTRKEISPAVKKPSIKNGDLAKMDENSRVIKTGGCLVVSSDKSINGIKSYIIIHGYDSEEENSSKNIEILKMFASQALFLYTYTHSS